MRKITKAEAKSLKKTSIFGVQELADYLNIGFTDTQNKLKEEWKDLPKEIIRVGSQKITVFQHKEIKEFFIKSGYKNPRELTLALKGYKEPLTKVSKGHGYYGVLLQSEDGQYIQCHVCGKLFKHMSGHLKTHKLNTKEYRKKFKISLMTALSSESMRWNLKRATMKWFHNLSEDEKIEYRRKNNERLRAALKKRGKGQPKKSLEGYNKDGTCPDQLLQKIKDVAKELEKTPSLREFVKACGTQKYKHLIFKVYGSWNKAIDLCGFERSGTYLRKGKPSNFSDEELLEYLSIFAQENGEVPTHTDFIAGNLPSVGIYTRRFGSIDKARQLAGVYEILDKNKVEYFKRKPKKIMTWYGRAQMSLEKAIK